MSSSNKNRSRGLRILWIPGSRKSHPKGRFDSTNKNVSYESHQKKKNEVWSLGGSRNQRGLLSTESDTGIGDSPSISGLSTVSCALGTAAAVTEKCAKAETKETVDSDETVPSTADTATSLIQLPQTPDSTTSTALVVSPPNSPENQATTVECIIEHSVIEMPATTTTTAKIKVVDDENRFSILGKDITNDIDVYETKDGDLHSRSTLQLNALTPRPYTPTSPSTTSKSENDNSGGSISTTSSNNASPTKKKSHHKHHHNKNHHHHHPQEDDIISIDNMSQHFKMNKEELAWVDELVNESNNDGKDGISQSKNAIKLQNLDQMDGISVNKTIKENDTSSDEEKDDKLITCLHYTLMCCDCAIS